MAKFFPLDLSKFKRVSSDGHTTTLKHEQGHEVKIAHNVLSPKLRGNLAALPQHEEERGHEAYSKSKPTQARFKSVEAAVDHAGQYAKGGEIRQSNPKLIESKKLPHYEDGGDVDPEKAKQFVQGATESGYQPERWAENVKQGLSPTPAPTPTPKHGTTQFSKGGLAQPMPAPKPKTTFDPNEEEKIEAEKDPLPNMYAEGGEPTPSPEPTPTDTVDYDPYTDPHLRRMADGGDVVPLLAAIKKAAESRKIPGESVQNVGSKSQYQQNSPAVQYRRNMIQDVKNTPKPRYYAEGGKLVSGSASQGQIPSYAEDTGDVTPQDAPQNIDPQEVPSAMPDPLVSGTRDVYNQLVKTQTVGNAGMTLPGQEFGPNGEPPENFNSGAWNQAKLNYDAAQKTKAQEQQVAAQQGETDAKARMEAGLPPATPNQAVNSAPVSNTWQPSPQQQGGMPPQQSPQAGGAAPQQQQPDTGNPDLYGAGATQGAYRQGIRQAESGIKGEAAALGAKGAAEANVLQQGVQQQQAQQQAYQDHYNDLDQERQNFQQDIQNQHIDPNHYLNSLGTVGKISTGIGLILGGMGGGLTHQENPALKFLQSQIDRDINAQAMELGKKENLLSANMRQFGNLKDATMMTNIMQNDIIAKQIEYAAAKAQSPLAQARAQQAIGKLHMDSANMLGQMAMRRTLLSASTQGDMSKPQNMGQMLQAMRVYNPEMAKEYESRAIPGIGFAQIPIPDADKQAIVARLDLNNKLQKLMEFSQSHSGSLSPTEIAQGGAMARMAQDAYRQANKQGVFREAEKDFVDKSISDSPTKFLSNIRVVPAYRESIQANRDTLQNMASHYGLPMPNVSKQNSSFRPGVIAPSKK